MPLLVWTLHITAALQVVPGLCRTTFPGFLGSACGSSANVFGPPVRYGSFNSSILQIADIRRHTPSSEGVVPAAPSVCGERCCWSLGKPGCYHHVPCSLGKCLWRFGKCFLVLRSGRDLSIFSNLEIPDIRRHTPSSGGVVPAAPSVTGERCCWPLGKVGYAHHVHWFLGKCLWPFGKCFWSFGQVWIFQFFKFTNS